MSSDYPLVNALHKQGRLYGPSQCLPAPEPSALDQLEKQPLDDYLKTLLLSKESLLNIKTSCQSRSGEIREIEIIFVLEKQSCEAKNVKDAVIQLDMVILRSNFILEQVDKVLADVKEDVNEETIRKVTKLKKYLVKYTVMLDAILSHYTRYRGDLPQFEEVNKFKGKIEKIIEQMNSEDISMILPREIKSSEEGIICAALGLKSNMAENLKKLDSKFRNHRPDSYYLSHFLMCNMESANDEVNLDANTEAILKKYGFSEARSKILSDWISENKLSKQQTLWYWVEWYLTYRFEYDIFLCPDCPRYPFHEDEIDQWKTMKIDSGELEDGNEWVLTVPIINTSTKGAHCLRLDGKIFPPKEPQANLWYHGTLHKSADNIMYSDIQLGAGSVQQDFSDGSGFYLTPDYAYALEWAKGKGPEIAVIVFNIGPLSTEFTKMDLSERDKEWEQIVKYNRSGGDTALPIDLKKEFENCSYVTGPMSNVGRTSTPEFVEGDCGNKIMQMCIKSREMAKYVSSHICAVIFINDGMTGP